MPSLILDTGSETYRLSSSNSEPWQFAPYIHTPLQVIYFIFNILLHFTLELSHHICGRLDRGLKVERLRFTSASRIFTTASDLCLAANLCSVGSEIDYKDSERMCIGCTTSENNSPVTPGLDSYLCKTCRKKNVESTLFHTLMKFNNRIYSAKSSGGKHGLMSYTKQRQLLEFPTVKVSENIIERVCDSSSCPYCVQEYDIEYALDPALFDNLRCRLSYLSDRVSCCAISQHQAQDFISWVDSSFGASYSVKETEGTSQL